MSELQENIEAAVANAAEKIAQAETVQEAQAWQSIISNLNSVHQQIGAVETTSTNEIDVDEDENVGN